MADTAPAPSTNGRMLECVLDGTASTGIPCYARPAAPATDALLALVVIPVAAVPVAAPAAELLRFRRQAKLCPVGAQAL